MSRFAGSTPLIGLNAVVLQTETVGEDPAEARLIEIAALLLVDGELDEKTSWRRVPEMEELALAEAAEPGLATLPLNGVPTFPNLWPELDVLIGERIVIGHGLRLDFAALQAECKRSGFEWQTPPHLDVALLAQVIRPEIGRAHV